MPSSSSSEFSSSPAPSRKGGHVEVGPSESSGGHCTSNVSSAGEQDSDAAQPFPPTEGTALSHAERRRQKKRQRREQLAAASPRKKRKLDDDSSASTPSNVHPNVNAKTTTKIELGDPRRQTRRNSVWVGNLSFWTTQDALREFFDGVGTITRIHMPMRCGTHTQGENMGFAYVDFETPEAKVVAITLSEGQLDGRNLLIKDGSDFTGRPAKTEGAGGGEGGGSMKKTTATDGKGLSKAAQKILRAQRQQPAPTLFLGNLGFDTTEGSIRELFEAHRHWGRRNKGKGVDIKAGDRYQGKGEDEDGAAKPKDVWIRKIRMGTFEDSGVCKGFAFVDFTSVEHATDALINPRNHHLNGRDLVVEYASLDAVRRSGGSGPKNPKGDHDRKSKVSQKHSAHAPYKRPHWQTEQTDGVDSTEASVETTTRRSERPNRADRNRQPYIRRAKPGATLAHAQRQSAAILPGQGQKIAF